MLHNLGRSEASFIAPATRTFTTAFCDSLREVMRRYPDTQWYLVDTPDGPARALRGLLTFIEYSDDGDTATSKQKEVCPISFSLVIHGIFAACDADNCLLFAHALRYSKEDSMALLFAIDGIPGCDQPLRTALLTALLPETTIPAA